MTFRARPVSKRPSRAGWDDERRTALINGAFLAAIVISALLLVGYAAWSWYSDHLGAAATVDGTTITRDELRLRAKIESFRIGYTEQRIRDLLASGRITQAEASQQLSFLDQRRQSLDSLSLERLIDAVLQARLAGEEGVTTADGDIDEQLRLEATLDEQRHVWMIEVEPQASATTGDVGDAEKAAARAKAEKALADLRAGKSWDDVAKTVSTATSAPQAGDIGWMPKDSGYDLKFMDAVFAAPKDTPTDVVEGADGTFRIGRATEIAPAATDDAYAVKIEDAGIAMADYRNAVKADVVRKKLSDKVVADLSKPGPQRHVLEIFLPAETPVADGVKVRHILVSPNDDPSKASGLPAEDPAWAKAKAEADDLYHQLLRDPSKFDQLARAHSDDTGSKANGGKLPFYNRQSAIANEFADAIFQEGLRPGQILAPVKSGFGYHVIQFMRPYGDGDEAWMDDLKQRADAGIDFSQLARDNSEGEEAAKGGDIGWVIQGQLGDLKEGQIFETPIGKVSDVLPIENEGVYLYKVLEEKVMPPTDEQIKVFEDSGFSNWYALKKSEAKIDRNLGTDASA